MLEYREAVHRGEPNVEKDDVRNLVLGVVEPLLAGLRDRDPVAIQLQLELVHLSHGRIIFDKEDVYVLVDDFSHVPSLGPPNRKADIMPVIFPPLPSVASIKQVRPIS